MATASKGNGRGANTLSQYQPKSGAWAKPKKKLANYLRFRFTCVWQATPACKERKGDLHHAKPADVTLDHLIARAEYAKLDKETQEAFGSVNSDHNLVMACRSCNSARSAKAWTDFGDADAHARILMYRDFAANNDLAEDILKGRAPHPARRSK